MKMAVHDGRLWHRVQQSPFIGSKSRRRVMYIPIITGAYQPKHKDSPTPFYHRLAQLKGSFGIGKVRGINLPLHHETVQKARA